MRAVIDTSSFVALFVSTDRHHQACVEALKQLEPPLLTSWSVITEAHYLLRRSPSAIEALFKGLRMGFFQIEVIPGDAVEWFDTYLKRYSDLTPQIADISLIYLAQKHRISAVFTLDRRDFSVYRFDDTSAPQIIP